MSQKIKAGFISYLNAYPYYFPFEQGILPFYGQKTLDFPQALNKKLRANELDISLISSMEYAKNFHQYLLIDKISLSSSGLVNSVKLCSQYPLEELSKKTISLTNTSATSQAVLKIILEEKGCIGVNYTFFDKVENLKNCDAYLIIGDDALRPPLNSFKYQYDLAKIWYELYSTNITFALAAVRRDSWQKKKESLQKFIDDLCQAPHLSLKHQDFFSHCKKKFKLPIDLQNYFNFLNYEAKERQHDREFLFLKFHQFGLINQKVQKCQKI